MKHDYDFIPLSIIIFQNNKLIYCNKYLKEIFKAQDQNEVLEKLLLMVNLSNEKELYRYFLKNQAFKYKDQKIKLKHMKKEYDLFIFTKMDEKLFDEESTVIKDLIKSKIEMLSFYKGIRIYSKEEVIAVNDSKILVKVSKKQQLNLYDNKEYFIKINNQCHTAKGISFNKEKKILTLSNIKKETKNCGFDRDEVRLKIKTNKIHIPVINKDLDIYDISEKSICFISDKEYDLSRLNHAVEIKVPFMEELLYVNYMKKVVLNDKIKYIFHLNSHSKKLSRFLHDTQEELIKESISSLKI